MDSPTLSSVAAGKKVTWYCAPWFAEQTISPCPIPPPRADEREPCLHGTAAVRARADGLVDPRAGTACHRCRGSLMDAQRSRCGHRAAVHDRQYRGLTGDGRVARRAAIAPAGRRRWRSMHRSRGPPSVAHRRERGPALPHQAFARTTSAKSCCRRATARAMDRDCHDGKRRGAPRHGTPYFSGGVAEGSARGHDERRLFS
jgi:hypothetical protein